MPLVYGFSLALFGQSLLVIRLVALALALGTVVITYFLGRQLYNSATGVCAVLFHLALSGGIALAVFAIWIFYAAQLGILAGQIEKIVAYSGIQYLAEDIVSRSTVPDGTSNPTGLPEPQNFAIFRSGIAQRGLETVVTRLPSAIGVAHIPLLALGMLLAWQRRNASDMFLMLWVGVVSLALFLTLPDHRYFMLTFPALAILTANALQQILVSRERVVVLSLLFWGGSLYLFADWLREVHLFL